MRLGKHDHLDARGGVWRFCKKCYTLKPRDVAHFSTSGRSKQGDVEWHCYCRPCLNKYRRDRYASNPKARQLALARNNLAKQRRKERDPEGDRQREAASRRKYRRANPDKVKAAQKRYRERIAADPRRLAEMRERERMNHHLRAERAGKPVTRTNKTVISIEEHPRSLTLPGRPLYDAIVRAARRHDLAPGTFAKSFGVSDRRLYSWRMEEWGATQDYADRVLTALRLNPEDVFSDEICAKLRAVA